MFKLRKRIRKILFIPLLLAVAALICVCVIHQGNYSFARSVGDDERQLRMQVVSTAECWLGSDEGSDAHGQILTIYNTHQPLAQGYEMTASDNWCAAFVSTVAIECGLTDIIPTECSCQRQIDLFQEIGCWVEDDGYEPLPGDIIYYCNSDRDLTGDCTGWSDHVGIVVGTWGPLVKVIEGNNGDSVKYRFISLDAPGIRGYATPDYKNEAAH